MVIYNCYNITMFHHYFYILKNTEMLMAGTFFAKMVLKKLFRIF